MLFRSYMGKEVSSDTLKGGGTSKLPEGHSGAVVSPSIFIQPTANPELRFKSWFEIEGENPDKTGFDKMLVLIAHGTSLSNPIEGDQVLLLNPFADPVVKDKNDKPYTSAGFNKVPIWVPYAVDLSAYVNSWIKIVFVFDTVDNQYNGFRGWMIDDVIIVNKP